MRPIDPIKWDFVIINNDTHACIVLISNLEANMNRLSQFDCDVLLVLNINVISILNNFLYTVKHPFFNFPILAIILNCSTAGVSGDDFLLGFLTM